MAHSKYSFIHRAVGTIGACLLLTACQAAPISPSVPVAPDVPEAVQRVISAPPVTDEPAAADANDYILVRPASAPVTVSLTYPRGVEEELSWTGAGTGVATLINAHGQVVYRVSQEGDPVVVTVPAGQYTLRLEQFSELLAVEAVREGATRTSRRFNSGSLEVTRGTEEERYCRLSKVEMKTLKELARQLMDDPPLPGIASYFEDRYAPSPRYGGSRVSVEVARAIQGKHASFAYARNRLRHLFFNDFFGGRTSLWCPEVRDFFLSRKWNRLCDADESSEFKYALWYELLP